MKTIEKAKLSPQNATEMKNQSIYDIEINAKIKLHPKDEKTKSKTNSNKVTPFRASCLFWFII